LGECDDAPESGDEFLDVGLDDDEADVDDVGVPPAVRSAPALAFKTTALSSWRVGDLGLFSLSAPDVADAAADVRSSVKSSTKMALLALLPACLGGRSLSGSLVFGVDDEVILNGDDDGVTDAGK